MWRALWWKELREAAPISAAGLAAMVLVAAHVCGVNWTPWTQPARQAVPFVGDASQWLLALVAAALAIGLALRQTLGEAAAGTLLFLLHRPAPWRVIWRAKIAAGLAAYAAPLVLGVLFMIAWAATAGTHASPFLWEMTEPLWRTIVSIAGVYLAALLCGVRPARWLGSRLWPLAGVAALLFLVFQAPYWWLCGAPLCLLLAVGLAGTIEQVALERDYP